MKSIEVRTRLTCSPAALWRVLLDFPAYPEWNPLFSLEAIGAARAPGRPLAAGDRLRLLAGDPDSPGRRLPLRVEVVAHDPERLLAWKGGIAGIALGNHRVEVVRVGGELHLDHGETFSGILPGLLTAGKLESFRRAYALVSERMVARAAR